MDVKHNAILDVLKMCQIPEGIINEIAKEFDWNEKFEFEKNKLYHVTMTREMWVEFCDFTVKKHK